MDKTSDFLPGVFFRRYAPHIIIFAVSLAVYIFVFAFFAKETAAACAEIYRYNHTTCREAVVSASDPKPDGDSFYNLNGNIALSGNGKRLFCDAYMTKNGVTYRDNAILFDGAVNPGECLISKNSASAVGLKPGDEIVVKDKNVSYRIIGYLAPQTGLDGKYGYDGVIVLAYNDELVGGAKYSNLSDECDVYYGRESSTFLINLKEAATQDIIVAAIFAAAAFVVCFAVCEYFIFSPRYSDYFLMNNEGLPARKLSARIILDTFIKYLLPLLPTIAIFFSSLWFYGKFYLLPAAIYFVFAAVFGGGYSLILRRRLTKCHRIRQ